MNIQQHVADIFLASHPEDAARILERIPMEPAALQLEQSAPALVARVVNRMNIVYAAGCLGYMNPMVAAAIINHVSKEQAALLLRRLDNTQSDAVLANMPRDSGAKLRAILKYPEGTAGTLADFEVFTLLEEFTIKEAIDGARKNAQYLTRYLYVLNREKQLLGVLNVGELFMADPGKRVSSIMQKNLQKLFAYTSLDVVASHQGWLHHYALPVVEEGNLFLGVLRFNTLRKIEQESLDSKPSSQLGAAGTALGELYKVGFYGLLQSGIPQVGPQNK